MADVKFDRGALYYPYIHVRDESWLKATLLCFPYIERMIPEGYEVNDQGAAHFFATHDGRFEKPMLRRRSLDDGYVEQAQTILSRKLAEDLEASRRFAASFSQAAAAADGRYSDGANAFQIHEDKIAYELLNRLRKHDLAWDPERPVRGGARWWAVHPRMGEAIIGTNAVALATGHDLEIVTNEASIHDALIASDADSVYDRLIRSTPVKQARDDATKVNDLMRFVVYSEFDIDSLSPEQVLELSQKRADISALKAKLASLVADVGAVPDREVWDDYLRERATEALREWNEQRPTVKGFLRKLADKDLKSFAEVTLKDVAKAASAGAAASVAGVVPGVIVGALFYAGSVVYRRREEQRKDPYRFLSKLMRATGGKATRSHLLSTTAPASLHAEDLRDVLPRGPR